MRKSNALTALALLVLVGLGGCGGGANSPSTPPTPAVTPTPTPTPTPEAVQPAACKLTAPTVDCSTRAKPHQELAGPLQAALDTAMSTAGVMYTDVPSRVYDLPVFRDKVVKTLSNQNLCGAWDYGNTVGDEIYLRSADGCMVEQYDIITGQGGIRTANKGSNVWSAEWGTPVPDPKPSFPRDGDLSCPLPGDRATFCFSIKQTPGEYGPAIYQLMTQVLAENPQLFDSGWYIPGAASGDPSTLKLPGWHIKDVGGYVNAVLTKIRANGFCGFVQGGDILLVKSVARGNIFHEEFDIVQNPPDGGDFVLFAVKDRCHDAGF